MAVQETKMITKSENDEDYYTKRQRAQKINFAKIQELLQRNVSKNTSKTFTQYTKELVKTYLASPGTNIDTIREVSRFLVRNSMIYKKMIYYYATAPLFLYSITQENDLSKSINANKSLKGYEAVLKRLNGFKMAKEFYTVLATTIRDGMYVGFIYDDEQGNTFLMPLDIQYCRIYGKTPEGEWIVYFDASYFSKGNNKDFVEGVDGDGVGVWDSCFVDGYNAYQSDRNVQWFRLTPERTMCIICGTDDEFDMPMPFLSGIFIELLDLLDLEQILADRTELENYILLVSKIPLINGSNDIDDFSISLELAQQFNQMLEEVVPELVGVAYSPMEIDTVKFDKSNSTENVDKLAQSMNNLFNNAGMSQLVVAGGASTNSVGLTHAIENDMSTVWIFVNRIESWMNYYIKNNISEGYIFKFHQISWYNRDTYISNMQGMATLGGNAIDYFVCATGKTPYEVLNDVRFNALALNINQWLVPLSSSYTKSKDDGSDTGGAPTKSDGEITSEETIATRDGNKNENTTSKVE